MIDKKVISQIFLFGILAVALYFCYLLLKPFLMIIVVAGMLVSIFYGLYERLARRLGNRQGWAALIMCILITVLIILPVTQFVLYLSKKSVEGYGLVRQSIINGEMQYIIDEKILSRFDWIDPRFLNVQDFLIKSSGKISDTLVSGGTSLVKGTTQIFTGFMLLIFTIFFLFRDGEKLVKRMMYLTPLSNKYDKEIFQKFRDVSYSSIISTFVTAIAQGVVGAVGFIIIGIPAFFPGVAMAFVALLPYVGAALVWFPVAIYLLIVGQIWQGIFLLAWGFLAVSMADNLLRPLIIKGKAQVHPLIIFFSIFGGILLFGFWGVLIGPIIISVAFTILHIYEMEYEDVLER
ncbi:MAG: AI-2E family transporter [Patescibacteria group bacterium]